MFTYHRSNINKSGFTLVEIIIGTSILVFISSIVGYWFYMQRNYQHRVVQISEAQQNIRKASWQMVQELRTARIILWPRVNIDDTIHSDSKVVFKNFQGDIVCYYFDSETEQIKRCLIPNGIGSPVVDNKIVGKGFSRVYFTAHDVSHHLIGIFMQNNQSFGLESVYLLNE